MGQKNRKRLKHVPQRTCVACRRKVDKRQLTRIVRTSDASVVVDPTGKRNGRGAYVCEQPACWEMITENNRLLNQALVTEVSEADLAALASHKPHGVQADV